MHQDQSKRQANCDRAVTAGIGVELQHTGDSLSFSIAPQERTRGRASKYTRIFPLLSREGLSSAAIALWWQQQLAGAAERLLGSQPATVSVRRLSVEEGLIYRSAIAFPLAKLLSRSPLRVACQLLGELPSELPGPATASVCEPGWLDWELGDRAVAAWLAARLPVSASVRDEIAPATPTIGDDSFFVQYTYDRAQMLLRLGTERGLVRWEGDRWQEPLPVPWQLEGSALWGAIAALVDLCDRGEAPPGQEWLAPAMALSEAIWELHREVPLFGDVSRQHPESVLSRLGILAIARSVLGWTLSTRLGVVKQFAVRSSRFAVGSKAAVPSPDEKFREPDLPVSL